MITSLATSVVDLIGNTPLVELNRIVAILGLTGRLLAKVETSNPGLSKKDRIAREIIQQARVSGELGPGQPVVELTSGNTGAGLAIVCRALGHPFIAVMSRGNSSERSRQMAALGAEVYLVDQATGGQPGHVTLADLALVEATVNTIARERGAFVADQFHRAANILAHENGTGPEIWRQASGNLDVFLDFVGTGGTFTGVTRALRRENPRIRAYVVEPASAAVLAGRPLSDPMHKVQGGGYAIRDLPLLDRSLVTGYLTVTDEAAVECARLLAREEGLLAGFSSGAHLSAAIGLLRSNEAGSTIAFLVCDSGLKYLSTDLFP